MITNQDIRQEARAAGIHLWQIAEKYGLNDGNFSRKLRQELPDAEKIKIHEIITNITNGGRKT